MTAAMPSAMMPSLSQSPEYSVETVPDRADHDSRCGCSL